MTDAEPAKFILIDKNIKEAMSKKGVDIMPIQEAWEKHPFAREYIKKKPLQGYFIWVREQTSFPVSSCVSVSKKGFQQEMTNLIVVEPGISAKAIAVCNALKPGLACSHKANGFVVLKKDSSLEVDHTHTWGKGDRVMPEYRFFLSENSRLDYSYRSTAPVKNIKLKTNIECEKNASASLRITTKGSNTKMEIDDTIVLKGEGSKGNIMLRLVADNKTEIKARSVIDALKAGKGHLDCQGILLSDDSSIELVPIVRTRSKESEITHEASIGKISGQKMDYLRSRGFSEEEAIRMIVNGFLNT